MKKSLLVLLLVVGLLAVISASPPSDLAQSAARDLPSELVPIPTQPLAVGQGPLAATDFVTSDILISRAENRQSYPDVAYNSDKDEWLVVWQDKREGTWDIWGQIVDAEGVIRGAPHDIGVGQGNFQYPAVAYDATQKRYLVVWQDTTNSGIYCRVLSSSGGPYSPVAIVTSGAKARTQPDVAYNPVTDEYLVVWQVEESAGNHDIWGRKVGVDGVLDPGGAYAISTLTADEIQPALLAYPVTSASPGRYLLAFSANIPGNYNIVGRRLLSDGSPAGAVFGVSTDTDAGTGDEHWPEVALDTSQPGGAALVVWESISDMGGHNIVGRLIDITQSGSGVRGDWLVIEAAAGDQQFPSVTYNGAEGEYVVVWDDDLDMYGSRVEADASAAGEPFVLSAQRNSQRYGTVAFGTESTLVAWTDYRSPWADIMGQRLSQTGGLLGAELGLSVAVAEQSRPALAWGGNQEEWFVVWQEQRPPSNQRIWGQFVGRDGLLEEEPLEITALTAAFFPDIDYNPDADEFLVVWETNFGANHDIYGQRVNASTRSLSGGLIQIETDPSGQYRPTVAYNSTDDLYLVAWQDNRDAPVEDQSKYNIYGRRLNGDGSFSDTASFVICARDGREEDPEVAFNPVAGSWLATWSESMASGTGISGQRVGSSDPPLIGNVIDIHLVADGADVAHSLACNTNRGVWLSVWEDHRNPPDGATDLYGRRINGQGKLVGQDDWLISDAPGNQWDPYVAFDPSTRRYTIIWEDYRFGHAGETGPDIVGQTLEASGSLLFTESDANAAVFVYAGDQVNPAVAGNPQDGRGLVVWEDWRSYHSDVYGRVGDPQESLVAMRVFLPVVLKDH